jgi:Family of unknown function (DUF6152)
MLKRATVLTSLLATSLILPFAVHAHHSFAAEFDVQKVVHLEGTVVKFAWVNPHSWLYIDVPKSDGTVEQWKIEGGAPSALLRRGWNRNSLPAGTKIVVNAFRARDGALRASARDIVFPDGRKLDIASSYQTRGKDEKDEKEKDEK